MRGKKWTQREIDYIIKNVYKISSSKIGKQFNRTQCSVAGKMSRLGLLKSRKRFVNHSFFKTWSEEMAYIFGYFCADGCMSRCGGSFVFAITSNDLEIIQKIRRCMKSTHKIVERTNCKHYSLSITSEEIYNDLKKLGCHERKSVVLKFPKVKKKYMQHFLRGFFDGDGGLSLLTHRCYPRIGFPGSNDFISNIDLFFNRKLGVGNTNIYKKEPSRIFIIYYNAENAQTILEYMYNNATIYLERKYKKYQQGMKWKRSDAYWTDAQKNFLRDNHNNLSFKELAVKLNKSVDAVRTRLWIIKKGVYTK